MGTFTFGSLKVDLRIQRHSLLISSDLVFKYLHLKPRGSLFILKAVRRNAFRKRTFHLRFGIEYGEFATTGRVGEGENVTTPPELE